MRRRSPPPLTWRRVVVDLVGLAVLALALRHAPASPVHVAFWGFFISLLTGIWDAISASASFVADALVAAVGWLKQKLFLLSSVLGQGVSFLGDVLKKVGEIFLGLWNDVLKPFFTQVYKWLMDLGAFLKKVFSPVVKFLLKVRDQVLKFYDHFVAPVIKALNIVNGALQILSDLGVKWAQTLELKIRQLEDWIRAPFTYLVDKLNEVIGIINRIVTLDGLLQRLTLFKSLLTYRRDYVNFSINSIVRPMDPGRAAAANAPYGEYTAEDHASNVVGQWNNGWQSPSDWHTEVAGELVLSYQRNGLVRG